jgi:hypothetical protein
MYKIYCDTNPNVIHEASFHDVKVGVWCILSMERFMNLFNAELNKYERCKAVATSGPVTFTFQCSFSLILPQLAK